MNIRHLSALRPLVSRPAVSSVPRLAFIQSRFASTENKIIPPHWNETATGQDVVAIDDVNMNGGYVNPPPLKRILRDPYADWWDKQERRNFGEPVHEDNDVLGVFSPDPYTHAKPIQAWTSFGVFVLAVFGLCGVIYQVYPDKPSSPRTFPGGLEAELGGPTATRARMYGEDGYESTTHTQ